MAVAASGVDLPTMYNDSEPALNTESIAVAGVIGVLLVALARCDSILCVL
jgi:hypothetical protein